MKKSFKYAEPLVIKNIQDCEFYHCMDVPGVGIVGDQWDLRDTIDDYLGNFDFAGKRALDVGTASGFLSFEMEKRGADVVSFDIDDGMHWNLVPHFQIQHEIDSILERRSRGIQKIKNGYWFTHEKLKSQAKVYYGDIYNLPEELGMFDVVVFGMILSHLRDPFQALYSASRLASETIIVTNQAMKQETPIARFMPNPEDELLLSAWWAFSEGCLKNMLGVLGFEVIYAVDCEHKSPYYNNSKQCTAFVAQRIS